jgi:hypothetical protein
LRLSDVIWVSFIKLSLNFINPLSDISSTLVIDMNLIIIVSYLPVTEAQA